MKRIESDKYCFQAIEGRMGDGKTLFLASIAVNNFEKYKNVYANFHIDVPNFIFVPKIRKEIIHGFDENSLFLLQEGYHYFDKRDNTTKKNKEIMHAIFQIRKNQIDVMVDIIELNFMDFRAIRLSTGFFSARGNIYGKYKGYKNFFIYYSMNPVHLGDNNYFFNERQKYFLDMSKYYSYYNTKEKTGHAQKLIQKWG